MERRRTIAGEGMIRLALFFGIYFFLLLLLKDSHKALEGAAIFSLLELFISYGR